jgi:hypothetical protein
MSVLGSEIATMIFSAKPIDRNNLPDVTFNPD